MGSLTKCSIINSTQKSFLQIVPFVRESQDDGERGENVERVQAK